MAGHDEWLSWSSIASQPPATSFLASSFLPKPLAVHFVHRCVGPMMVRSMKWSLSDIVLNQCRPFSSSRITLDNVLGLGPCASGVSTVGVTRELDLLGGRQFQNLLESTADIHQNVLTLLIATTLAAGHVTIASAWNALSYGASPDTDSEERLSDVDNNTHDLTVVLVLESLANSGHHNLEPETVDVDVSLVLVLVGPLATVLVLGVLPLGADTGLEQMVVGLEREFRNGGNVVLKKLV